MKPQSFTRIIDRKRYSTATATLVASDAYWDGHNYERRGRNSFLYRTPKGSWFVVNQTHWQGEQDQLVPVDQDEAVRLYEGPLSSHDLTYEQAFPGVVIEEA